ncbi:hypothetical protein NQN45_004200 [Vibrio vulnificus]|nr:hypothetical protein [Vibrio vulnificus]
MIKSFFAYYLKSFITSVELGGEFHTPTKGIARGSSISPLLGAMHLYLIDAYFAQNNNLYYARYMDDFVILTKTRWHLRKAVKRLNQFFNIYGFKQHPDKTFIGRIDKGFDWMGFQFTRDGIVDIAPRSLKKILENIQRLYEQAPQRVAEYLNRSLSYFIATTHSTGVRPPASDRVSVSLNHSPGRTIIDGYGVIFHAG